jgi:hypothetical protein
MILYLHLLNRKFNKINNNRQIQIQNQNIKLKQQEQYLLEYLKAEVNGNFLQKKN